MRLVPQTLAGRTIALLLVAVTAVHLLSLVLYQAGLKFTVEQLRERHIAEQLLAVKRALGNTDPQDREQAAHALSGTSLSAHWGQSATVQREGEEDTFLAHLRAALATEASALKLAYNYRSEAGIAIPDKHVLVASLPLADGSWLNAEVSAVGAGGVHGLNVLWSTSAMALGVILVAIWLIRSFTAPLRALARAADKLGLEGQAEEVSEQGPREIAQAAEAFNRMQARIRRLIRERSEMLAAISHDLRTPLARLKLRLDAVSDPKQQKKMLRDLEEMEALITAALAYLREELAEEAMRPVDLGAMLEAIAEDAKESGHDIVCGELPSVVLQARPQALRRAIHNLIENAAKYGERGRVSLLTEGDYAVVRVEDDGPGLPDEARETVIRPFTRLESSRSRETGGVGLGLAIVHSVALSHKGALTLSNRAGNGLQADLRLPLRPGVGLSEPIL